MKGELDLAIEQYRRAIEVKPGLTPAHFHLGLALLRRGDKREAKPHFLRVYRARSGLLSGAIRTGGTSCWRREYWRQRLSISTRHRKARSRSCGELLWNGCGSGRKSGQP